MIGMASAEGAPTPNLPAIDHENTMLVGEERIGFGSQRFWMNQRNSRPHCPKGEMAVSPFVERLDEMKAGRSQRCRNLGMGHTVSPYNIDCPSE